MAFYALQIVLVRGLGLRDYGLWSVFYSVFVVGMIFSCFGLNHSARRHIAEQEGAGAVPDLLRSIMKLRLLVSVAAALLWWALSGFIAIRLGKPELAPLFAWSAPLLVLCTFGELFKELFIGLRRIDYNCLLSFVEHAGKIALVLLAFAWAVSTAGALAAFTAALALAVVCGFWLLREYFCAGAGESFCRPLAAYAMPLLVSELLFVLLSELDTILLGMLRPPEEVGLYSVSKQVMFKAPHLALALGMGILPVFAKTDKPLAELKPLFVKLLRLNTFSAGAAALLLVALGGPVLALLFGEESRGAASFFPWLAPYLLAATYNVYFSYLLEYRGQARLIARNLSAALLCAVVLLVWLVPHLGAKGAAIAMSCGYVLLALLNWRAASKLFA